MTGGYMGFTQQDGSKVALSWRSPWLPSYEEIENVENLLFIPFYSKLHTSQLFNDAEGSKYPVYS